MNSAARDGGFVDELYLYESDLLNFVRASEEPQTKNLEYNFAAFREAKKGEMERLLPK
ncbi:MAG: hypothetical protein ABDH63_06805 [Candidatus Caldarchaeales archaeon]